MKLLTLLLSVLLPVLPTPKSASFLDSNHSPGWSSFSLASDFPSLATEAVWEEICAFSCSDAPGRRLKVELRLDTLQRGCALDWKGAKVRIKAADAQGAIRSLQILKQLIRYSFEPDLRIEDWPDYERRVFMDDISRGAVPNLEQFKRQIRLLSEWGYNALMLYNENIISTSFHPDIAPPKAAISLGELDQIVEYASRYGMSLIGGFQSFGHFEKTLSLPQYSDMGLSPNMIDPRSEKARNFLSDVISELCDHSSAGEFCVFCDETFDLDSRSDKVELYSSHLNFLHSLLASKGKRMIVCGDVIMKYPAILEKIPQDVIIFSWNYDSPPDFSPWLDSYDGRELWVAPGVHSCLRMLPDLNVSEGNRRFVRDGYLSGSRGCIVCTWDESVFHSVANLNYGIARFAQTMWNSSDVSEDQDFASLYEISRFGSRNGAVGIYQGMMELGDIPMFSSMNDRVFHSRFTPAPNLPLSLDSRQIHKADSLLSPLEEKMKSARTKAKRADDELLSWDYILRCYRFMIDSRLKMLSLQEDSDMGNLLSQTDTLSGMFSEWWLYENKDYNLDEGLALIDGFRDEILALQACDISSLQVLDRLNPYMCFFLTSLLDEGENPSFEKGVEHVWPSPGAALPTSSPKPRRWTKTESLSGLSMDLNEFYSYPPSLSKVLCYAVINSEREQEVRLLLGYVGKMEVFLGEEKLWDGPISNTHTVDEQALTLPLKPGRNHLFLCLEKLFPEFSLSVYMDGAQYKSNKHRYTIL
ncbi:MAG: hypothetical protein ACI3Y7_01755 [Candidatus Cryptobacteroides sp.]